MRSWGCPFVLLIGLALAGDAQPLGAQSAISTRSLYVAMRDGTLVAIDVMLPADRRPGARLPTVLETTRYWRAIAGRGPDSFVRYLVARGYAVVRADERGTGASTGTWRHPFPPEALADARELVDWITAQSWSNGAVAGAGVSYEGATAFLLAATGHPAVKAVVSQFATMDVYSEIAYPGGDRLEWFVRNWSELARRLDAGDRPGDPEARIKPVDADADGQRLASILARRSNPDPEASFREVVFRDDASPAAGASLDDLSPYRWLDAVGRSGAAVYSWGSWMDAGTAKAVLARFVALGNPQRAVIGPWSHGGGDHASPFLPIDAPTDPSTAEQRREAVDFLDLYLKDAGGTDPVNRVLFYYTMGEEKWKSTTVWPPVGVAHRRFFLAPGARLAAGGPGPNGSESRPVDFAATTGAETRWHTELTGGDVVYADRALADRRLLVYTSDPLPGALEVTGHPVVDLRLSASIGDVALFAYLEDVDPDGRVTYLTEGQLRVLHGETGGPLPRYFDFDPTLPLRSYARRDAQALSPGVVGRERFALQPTSVLIRPGHRIRLAVGGHDAGLFARVPPVGDPTLVVHRGASSPSFLDLPVVDR
jgi:putative CocE/NonD family hydrolase